MKILVVILLALNSICNFNLHALKLKFDSKASNQDNISKLIPESSIDTVNRTENATVDNVPVFHFHSENVTEVHLVTSPNPQAMLEDGSFQISEDRRSLNIDSQDSKSHNFTKPDFDSSIESATSTHEMMKIQEYSVENITIEVKAGNLVNLTCGPDDVTKIVETNLGTNLSIGNLSWQWKVLWLNFSSEKEADGIQIIENGRVIVLLIESFKAEHSGTYMCAVQDPSDKVWILKSLQLVVQDSSKGGVLESGSDGMTIHQLFSAAFSFQYDSTVGDFHPTVHPFNHNPETNENLVFHPTNKTVHSIDKSEQNPNSMNKWISSENSLSSISTESPDISPAAPSSLIFNNSIRDEADRDVPTPKTIFASEALTIEDDDSASESQIAEEPAKMEEQKAFQQTEEENNASGVAIGVALAIILTAVATTLVLYRHRRNGKKSTYITFGNPSYSRENLPANDYGLDSPLTLSSNGYTVLA